MKGDRVVATNPKARFPEFYDSGDVMDLHVKWWQFRVERIGRRIRILRDDKVILDWTDPDKEIPRGGHFALWTYKNGIVYARIKSSAQSVADEAAVFLPVVGHARLGGWTSTAPARVRVEQGPNERVRVRNLFGGGPFAVRWDMGEGIDLTRTPRVRFAFRPHEGAQVNLHVVVNKKSFICRLNAPKSETYAVLGASQKYWAAWQPFAAKPLTAPVVEETSFFDPDRSVVEVDLLAEARRRFPGMERPVLTSLVVGNSSNQGYLMAGFGGNTSRAWYELGAVLFLPEKAR